MLNNGCIFCKIVKGEIPCYKIYEDKEVLAFLDINPVNPGHVLVIPKNHYELLEDLPDELLVKIIFVVKKLVPSVKNAVKSKGINLGLNNGREAGQLIPHVHFHIMPRFERDGHRLWEGKKLSDEQMKSIVEQIKKVLK